MSAWCVGYHYLTGFTSVDLFISFVLGDQGPQYLISAYFKAVKNLIAITALVLETQSSSEPSDEILGKGILFSH